MPIEEYTKEEMPAMGKRVIVEMTSTQNDMTGVGFFSVKVGKDTPPSKLLSDAPGGINNEYKLTSEGVLYEKDGRLCLSYEENAIEGVEGCTTIISFDLSDPHCVTVERCGALSSVFVISKGERLFSAYSTPFGTLDMCIFAKKVENELTENGGTLSLDYAVELRGLTAQRTRMDVSVRVL